MFANLRRRAGWLARSVFSVSRRVWHSKLVLLLMVGLAGIVGLLALKFSAAMHLLTRLADVGGNVNAGGAAGVGAGGAGAAGAATGDKGADPDPWWKKIAKKIAPKNIPLPGGFKVGTDSPRVGWGGGVEIGPHVSGGAGVSVSPTAGSDPTQPLINVDYNASVQVHPATEGPAVEVGVHGRAQVGVSQPVQQADSGGYYQNPAARQVFTAQECSDGTFGNCGN